MKNHASSPGFVLLLSALIALPALGTDMFAPAVPQLTEALGAPVSAGQFTLTAFFVGIAAGQIAWGPLSDRFGRKPVLLAGLGIMLLSSAAAAAATSVQAVSAARVAQGLGMSSGSLIGRTIVRDLYAHEEAARLLSRMTIVFSLVPLCAPVLGALLVESLAWPSVFVAMAAVALVLILLLRTLGETAPAARRSIRPGAIVRTFAAILADARFRAPFFLILCSHIGILAWVSSSSFALVRGLGVSTLAYGFMFGAVMLGQIVGAWAASRLVMRLGIGRLLRLGTALMLAAGAAAAALAWAGVAHWLAVVLPFTLFLFGTAIVFPNAMAAALTPFPGAAGSAASLIGAIGFAAGAVVSTALAGLFDGSARPLATVALLAGLGAFVFERLLRGSR
ncbi:MAG TPA: multidrug effflux MFS transporter [Burkholderiales bacterium]|nr:multidrug effflux MFS transporter [Burkholderiales bacterium]